MATKIGVFNAALIELGHRRLADTGEAAEAARELNALWTRVVSDCLSEASWNFAMETVKATADTGVTPEFGFTEVFAKPTDWLRTVAVSEDEYFSLPLLHYYDDASFWSANSSPIYVRYVSSDTGLGFELSRWSAAFTRYVELEHAYRVCLKITQNAALKEQIGKDRDKARKCAKNQDAMNEPQPKFAPASGWTTARWGVGGSRRDRGSRGNLTG